MVLDLKEVRSKVCIVFRIFFSATVANWVRCEFPEDTPDYVSFSGSAYWDRGDRVIRVSDHWGLVATCKWLIEHESVLVFTAAECYYDDFRSINNVSSIDIDH